MPSISWLIGYVCFFALIALDAAAMVWPAGFLFVFALVTLLLSLHAAGRFTPEQKRDVGRRIIEHTIASRPKLRVTLLFLESLIPVTLFLLGCFLPGILFAAYIAMTQYIMDRHIHWARLEA